MMEKKNAGHDSKILIFSIRPPKLCRPTAVSVVVMVSMFAFISNQHILTTSPRPIIFQLASMNKDKAYANVTTRTSTTGLAAPLLDKRVEEEEKYEKKWEHADDEEYATITKGKIIPTAIVIGTQKGGTTAVSHYLNQHPSVMRGLHPMEEHFFDFKVPKGPNNHASMPNGTVEEYYREEYLYRYHNRFNLTKIKENPNLKTYEKTPIYIFNPKVPYRMKSIVPKSKIITVLRDPVERSLSHYKMMRDRNDATLKFVEGSFESCLDADFQGLKKYGIIPKDFDCGFQYEEQAVNQTALDSVIDDKQKVWDIDWTDSCMDEKWLKYFSRRRRKEKYCDSIIGRGLYAMQLRVWWKVYSKAERDELMMFLKSEDMRPVNGTIDMSNLFEMMEVENMEVKEKKVVHKTNFKMIMKDQTRDRLRCIYRPFNAELERMLGDEWKDA
ncbi:hypothetical protein CTEN210_02815 [Chaetoceros tenuissimus]|uniref:Sulfotransferase domain-containing protein n=1 Tax=Chaetoceros tenuissimus TaxID=426638 RepID=A0AAD3CK45_9STRA|nr:hypothetical protein CTEN210_02815 [Chaetoceros tenuissimus]